MYEEYEQISDKPAMLKSSLIKKQKNGNLLSSNLSISVGEIFFVLVKREFLTKQ